MSNCNCGCTPCRCVPCDCPEVPESYLFDSINLAGITVLDGVVGSTVNFRGIRSENSNIVVSYNAGLGTVDLLLDDSTFHGTETFTNAAARALTVPDFAGQYGVQLDTDVPYIATGTNAGDWTTHPWFILGATNTVSGGSPTTTVDMSAGGMSVVFHAGAVAADVIIGDGGTLQVDGTMFVGGATTLASTLQVTSGNSTFGGGGGFTTTTFQDNVNFPAFSAIQAAGVTVPVDSVLITETNAGQLSSMALTEFISDFQTETYGSPVGPLTRTSFDTATVTLPELAECVAALLVDFNANRKPTF